MQLHEYISISILASLSGCIASIFLFFTDIVPSNSLVLGVIWALVTTSLDAAYSLTYALRSVIGAGVGASLGILCIYLSDDINAEYKHYMSTLIAFPCSLLLGLAEESTATPLSYILRQDVARLVLYAVASFEVQPERMTLAFVIGSSVGYLVTLAAVFAFPVAGSVTKMRRGLSGFSSAAVHVFECLVAYLTSGPDHRGEVDRRLCLLDAALEEVYRAHRSLDLAAWRMRDASLNELIDTLTLMPSQLLALIHTLDQRYSDVLVHKIWAPLAPGFAELASTTSMTLRNGGVEHALIPALSEKLYKQLIASIAELDELPNDLNRFVFSIVAVIRFSRLVNRFARLRAEWIAMKPKFSLREIWSRTVASLRSLGNRKEWRNALSKDPIFPFKIALIDQVAIQPLVLWKSREPYGLGDNALWAAVPLFFCLLPTFGGSLIKGARRVAGTVVGGALAVISVLVSDNQDVSALMLQLFLVGFVSKWISQIRFVGYAGLVVFVTWVIVALANFDFHISKRESFDLTIDRLVLTVIGSVGTAFLGGVILPKLGMRKNVDSVCRIISTCADLFTGGVDSVLSDRTIIEASSPLPAPELVSQYNSAAGFEANKKLRVNEMARLGVLVDSNGEANFFALFRIPGTHTLRRAVTRLSCVDEHILRLENASLVFFATAASTLFDVAVREYLLSNDVRQSLVSLADDVRVSASEIARFIRGEVVSPTRIQVSVHMPPVETDKRMWSLEGGMPRFYAFLFTLEEFVGAWNALIENLTIQK